MAEDGWKGAKELVKYDWRSVAGRCRVILFEEGASYDEVQGIRKNRKGFEQSTVDGELQRGGQL